MAGLQITINPNSAWVSIKTNDYAQNIGTKEISIPKSAVSIDLLCDSDGNTTFIRCTIRGKDYGISKSAMEGEDTLVVQSVNANTEFQTTDELFALIQSALDAA